MVHAGSEHSASYCVREHHLPSGAVRYTRLITLRTRHEWGAHSPDLNPLEFWLRGFQKARLYANKADKPVTLTQLSVLVFSKSSPTVYTLKNFFTLHLLCGVRILWDCSEVTIE